MKYEAPELLALVPVIDAIRRIPKCQDFIIERANCNEVLAAYESWE